MQSKRGRRKGQIEYDAFILGVEFVILAVILFTFGKIISNVIQPHFQIAYANAELLRSTIDELCEQGSGSVTLEDWSFPQPMPLTTTVAGVDIAKNILPKFMIKARGDPYFVLYYEAYPPPQAFGWELYQNIGNRTILPLSETTDIADANSTVQNRIAIVRGATGASAVVIPNIILGNKTRESWPGSDGMWKSKDTYSLSSYGLLPETEKSLIKYRACGDSALCMKTHDAVIRLPLPNCKGKIDYIQMYRETGDIFESIGEDTLEAAGISVGTWAISTVTQKLIILAKFIPKTLGKVVSGIGDIIIVAQLLSGAESIAADVVALFVDTESDFGLASPCKVSMDIEYTTCDCNNLQEMKLFAYDAQTDKLVAVGDYKTCLDRISGATGDQASFDCIKIGMRDESNFCRTRNVVLPFEGFVTSFGEAAQYDDAFAAVDLKSGDALRPGFASIETGWVWPGE